MQKAKRLHGRIGTIRHARSACGMIAIEKKRECLKCEKMFNSSWNGNRICRNCKP